MKEEYQKVLDMVQSPTGIHSSETLAICTIAAQKTGNEMKALQYLNEAREFLQGSEPLTSIEDKAIIKTCHFDG